MGSAAAFASDVLKSCIISGSGGFKSPKSPYNTYAAGTYTTSTGYVMTVGESRSTMTDVTGNRRGHNAVSHSRKRIDLPTLSPPIYQYKNTSAPSGSARVSCASGLAYQLCQPTLLLHEDVPDGTLIARARVPSLMKRQVDGLVELFELKDLYTMLGEIASMVMEAEHRRRLYGGGTTNKKVAKEILGEFVGSPSQFLKTAINGHLGYKFAIAPLAKVVNDVKSTLGRMDRAKRLMEEIPFAVHGSYVATKSYNYSDVWRNAPQTLGLYQSRVSWRKTTKVIWTQSALRRLIPNKLPSLNRLRLDAALEGLGLSPSLKTIWSVIPRSFVLDWFFPISDFLDQIDGVKPSDAWFETLNTYSAVKTVTTGSVTEEFAPFTSSHTSVSLDSGLEVLRGEFTLTDFARSALLGPTWAPAQIFVPEPRIPSTEQWAVIAEMIYQRAFKAFRVDGPSLIVK